MVLEAEGPSFMSEGKATKFRDAFEFKSANEKANPAGFAGSQPNEFVRQRTGSNETITICSELPATVGQ